MYDARSVVRLEESTNEKFVDSEAAVHNARKHPRRTILALVAAGMLAAYSGWSQSVTSYESLVARAKLDSDAGRLDQALAGTAQAIATQRLYRLKRVRQTQLPVMSCDSRVGSLTGRWK